MTKYQRVVAEWRQANFPNAKSYQQLLGVAEEVGELCRAHLKAEQGIRGSAEHWVEAKKDAVGDVLVYLMNYCSLEGLDVEDCLNVALEEIQKRDWVKFPGDGRTR